MKIKKKKKKKNVKTGRIPNRKTFFLRNSWLFFDGREKVLHEFRSGIFPFKTTSTHYDDLEKTLTPETSKTVPLIEIIY